MINVLALLLYQRFSSCTLTFVRVIAQLWREIADVGRLDAVAFDETRHLDGLPIYIA